ncbi:hypothetical protein B0T14DRAFT_235760 [Immersiella caudata]|uniref:Uncharacterized protein n=1 Tax=Immersiella caudata TaxID=314043 RepID=A0AA39WSA7_9PEZI|nr:hypothetical protein B0T14DRAFT_235760 [Immersiella caudata]
MMFSGRQNYSFFFPRGYANQPRRAHCQCAPQVAGLASTLMAPPHFGADSITGGSIYRNRGLMVGVLWMASDQNMEKGVKPTPVSRCFSWAFVAERGKGENRGSGRPFPHTRPQIGFHRSAHPPTGLHQKSCPAAQPLAPLWAEASLGRAICDSKLDITMTRASLPHRIGMRFSAAALQPSNSLFVGPHLVSLFVCVVQPGSRNCPSALAVACWSAAGAAGGSKMQHSPSRAVVGVPFGEREGKRNGAQRVDARLLRVAHQKAPIRRFSTNPNDAGPDHTGLGDLGLQILSGSGASALLFFSCKSDVAVREQHPQP